ncbi:XRE family transcriptional regulator (plasmid) [Brevibacillus laterosporus]|uniref:XRE family transcriptional regulator n=1 Tax=Brevibacillus laterosporus TaxID=1465 RepID=A0A518V1Q8_BRELA|nr:XRE family transcriptional regulator [Brevibacillus laterosporus]
MDDSLTFTTLGELIKKKREKIGISLSEVSRRTGVSKGVISKIECGDTKSPELRTLKPIADVLDIPYEDIIEYSIEIERRYGLYDDFLSEAIEISNPFLINKVAIKFLENIKKETCSSLDHLYTLANTSTNNDAKVTLYTAIVTYARVHGLPHYIAKGLLQKYLIERKDLKRMEESFKDGEEIIHYVDFLSHEEKINYYYRMALQAFAIKKYDRCIEIGNKGHTEDGTINELKERVALAILNSNSRMGNFTELEKCLDMYVALDYRLIIEKVKYFRAIILFKTGQHYEAIPLLKDCVEEATKDNRLHRINDLIEVFLKIDDLDSLQHIFEQEEKNTVVKIYTPYKYSELGKYYRYKGTFLVERGLFNEGMEAYLQSMYFYSKINDHNGIMGCQEDIYKYHCEKAKQMELPLLKKLTEVYNMVNKGDSKED